MEEIDHKRKRRIIGGVVALAGLATIVSPFIMAASIAGANGNMWSEGGGGGGGAIWLVFLLGPIGLALLGLGIAIAYSKGRMPFDPEAPVSAGSFVPSILRIVAAAFVVNMVLPWDFVLAAPQILLHLDAFQYVVFGSGLLIGGWSIFDIVRRVRARNHQSAK